MYSCIFQYYHFILRTSQNYSLHQKKVYTCTEAKSSKARWTRGKVGVAHPLLSIWPSSVLSTQLGKNVHFLLGETVQLLNLENIFAVYRQKI